MGLVDIVKNPFSFSLTPKLEDEDFSRGLQLEEIVDIGLGLYAQLVGNMMPVQPFSYGGSQHIVKEYYSGKVDPVVQVLGSREKDLTLRGRIHEKKITGPLTTKRRQLATAMVETIDDMRKRGNLVKLTLGEFQRWGYITEVNFGMKTLGDYDYEIMFSIVSNQPPENCPLKEAQFNPLFNTNAALASLLSGFEENRSNVPSSIPIGIGQLLNEITGAIAEVVHGVTSFVDSVVGLAEDITSSINRAVGLCTYAKTYVHKNLIKLGRISYNVAFAGIPVTSKYSSAAFIYRQQTIANDFMKLIADLEKRFKEQEKSEPEARYLVKQTDSLQVISNKFYATPENWERIYIHNRLTSTVLNAGQIIEIPKV